MAPQQHAAGAFEIGCGDADAEGEFARVILVPVAQFGGVAPVRAVEGVDQPLDPRDGIRQRGGARRGHAERDAFGAAAVPQCGQARARRCRAPRPSLCAAIRDRGRLSVAYASSDTAGGRDYRPGRGRRGPWRRARRRWGGRDWARPRPGGRSRPPKGSRTAPGTTRKSREFSGCVASSSGRPAQRDSWFCEAVALLQTAGMGTIGMLSRQAAPVARHRERCY